MEQQECVTNRNIKTLEILMENGITTLEELKELIQTIGNLPQEDKKETMDQRVTTILKKVGVPAHLTGYDYLRSSIIESYKDPKLMDLITKKLYPLIAKMYGTTPAKLERVMRTAVGYAFENGNREFIDKLFGFTVNPERGNPTNSTFIATIVDYMKIYED